MYVQCTYIPPQPLLETGVAQTAFAKKFGVHRTSVYRWWKRYCEGTRSVPVGRVPRVSRRQNRLRQSCRQEKAKREEIGDAVKTKRLPFV